MKILIIIINLFILNHSCNTSDIPKHEKIANEITRSTSKKLKAENGLYLIGTGGSMMNDVKMMFMSFNYFNTIKIHKARDLLVHCVEEYLLNINNNEKIRPYLHDKPFGPKNIKIDIWFRNSDNTIPSIGELQCVSFSRNKISYYIIDEKGGLGKSILEETYEEALARIVNNQENPTDPLDPGGI